MRTNNYIGKDTMYVIGTLFIVIVVLMIVCNVVSCTVNRAITKGVTDEVQVTIPMPQSPTDSVSQARFEEVLCQLQNENRERISNCIEAINGNLTLWMSLICAVCTLLPIASNLYYSYQMGEEERKFNENMNKQQEQLNQEKMILHLLQISSTLTLLCDMQQLFRNHNMFLTEINEMEQLLSALDQQAQLIQQVPDSSRDKESQQHFKGLYFFIFCKMESLLTTYETVFGYPRLMALLALKDVVHNCKEQWGCEGEIQLSDLKRQVDSVIAQLIHLFKSEIRDREKQLKN